MKPHVKAAWLHALRSGRYRQGRGRLRGPAPDGGPDLFCCLGVLCDLGARKAWRKGVTGVTGVAYTGPAGDAQTGFLPESINRAAGLSYDAMERLVGMNDHGRTFPQIAAWIERNL